MKKVLVCATAISISLLFSACKTRGEIKKEQEFEQLKQDVATVKTNKADIDTIQEDLKSEIVKLQSKMDEMQAQHNQQIQSLNRQNEDLKTELLAVRSRVEATEQRQKEEESKVREAAAEKEREKEKVSYDKAKQYFDEGEYADAEQLLKSLAKGKDHGEETRKARYLLAETHFATQDFASSAIEFGEYKKKYPKDSLVANCTYRQAQAFKNLGKTKEAKLFYQELIEKFPKHTLAAKAKVEMKKLK